MVLVRRGVNMLGDNKSLAILDQGLVSLASFVTNLLVARSCGKLDFGIYFLVLSLLHLVKGIQEQLILSPYAIYSQRIASQDRLDRYTGSTLGHQMLSLVFILLAVGGLGWLLEAVNASDPLVTVSTLLFAVAPVFLIREYLRRLSFARFKFITAIGMDTLMSLLYAGGIAAMAVQSGLTVHRAYLLMVVSSLLGIGFWISRREIRFHWTREDSRNHWRENWGFGRWALLTFVVGCSTPFLMPWIVAWMMSEESTGLFGACMTIVGVANMLIVGVGNYVSPLTARVFASSGPSGLWKTLHRVNLFFVVVLGSFFVAVALCGSGMGRFIFGPSFDGLGLPMSLLAFAQLSSGLGVVAGNGLWAIDQPRKNVFADVVTLIATVGTALLAIPRFGIAGAALGVLAGSVLGTCARWWTLVGLMGPPRSEVVPSANSRTG